MQLEKIRQRLIEGCHILAGEEQGDMIWGHVSARTEDGGRFLMKPAAMGLEEVDKADLIEVNAAGEKITGARPLHVEVFIHSEILRKRPEIKAVVHTHPIHAVAFSARERPLLAIGHEGAMFCDGLPVFTETSDLIVTPELGRRVANTMGDFNAMLLANHGIVTAGRSVEEAVMMAILLEKACKTQLMAEAAGEITRSTHTEEARSKRNRVYSPGALVSAFEYAARRHSSGLCSCRRAQGAHGHGHHDAEGLNGSAAAAAPRG